MTDSNKPQLTDQLTMILENQPDLYKLGAGLSGYRSATEPILELVDGTVGPFENQDSFERLALRTVARPVRIYSGADFPGEIIVPEEYAAVLDGVRSLRLAALRPFPQDPTAAMPGMSAQEAQVALEQSPYRNRPLPEELLYFLKLLPHRGFFPRVYLLDQANPRDLWLRQIYQSDSFASAMEVRRKTGELSLYKAERNEFLLLNFLHEWSHQLEVHSKPEEWQFFSDAVAVEWPFYVPDTYALKSYEEHWAVIGQDLLHPDAARFLTMAQKGPIRTTAFMAALESQLKALPEPLRSPYHNILVARCQYVRQQVIPQARANLAVAVRASAYLEKQVQASAQ